MKDFLHNIIFFNTNIYVQWIYICVRLSADGYGHGVCFLCTMTNVNAFGNVSDVVNNEYEFSINVLNHYSFFISNEMSKINSWMENYLKISINIPKKMLNIRPLSKLNQYFKARNSCLGFSIHNNASYFMLYK